MQRFLLPAALMAGVALAGEPLPDTTEECLSCETQVQTMYDMWTNETTVASILADLQGGCEAYPAVKKELCAKLAVSCWILNDISCIRNQVYFQSFFQYYIAHSIQYINSFFHP